MQGGEGTLVSSKGLRWGIKGRLCVAPTHGPKHGAGMKQ